VLLPPGALLDPLLNQIDLAIRQRASGRGRGHPPGRFGRSDAANHLALRDIAGDDRKASAEILFGVALNIEAQLRAPPRRIGPVTGETLVRKDWPDVAVELDRRRLPVETLRCGPDGQSQQYRERDCREAHVSSLVASTVRLRRGKGQVVTMVQFVPQEVRVERRHSTTKLTYADYLRFPDDGLRHEIIDGKHYVTPSPATRHQRISRNLLYLVQHHLESHPIGELFAAPFDALLSDFDIVVPDLLYLSNERSPFLTSKNLQGPPDLVIEILSPSTKSRDRKLKRDLYERVGVQEYWVVDPDKDCIDVYRRSGHAFGEPTSISRTGVLTTPLLPDFELPLARVLA
jgi:Uma2 family endonuclease